MKPLKMIVMSATLEKEKFQNFFAGAPLLEGCLAYLDCRVTDAYEGGDHTIYVGRVEDGAITMEGDPLIFFRAAYSGLRER